jgi:hypothetical protein
MKRQTKKAIGNLPIRSLARFKDSKEPRLHPQGIANEIQRPIKVILCDQTAPVSRDMTDPRFDKVDLRANYPRDILTTFVRAASRRSTRMKRPIS